MPHVFDPLTFPVEKVSMPHPYAGTKGVPDFVPGACQIVRMEDDHQILNPYVSNRYNLVPHREYFDAMNEAIGEVGIPVKEMEVEVGDGGGSARVIWTFDLPIEIADGDTMDLRLYGRNSYNYMTLADMELGAFRILCSNGLVVGTSLARAKKRHVPSLKVPALVAEIKRMMAQLNTFKNEWQTWDKRQYKTDRLANWLEGKRQVVSAKAQAEIIEYYNTQPDRRRAGLATRQSAWEAYNALTWFASHRTNPRKPSRVLASQEEATKLSTTFRTRELEPVRLKKLAVLN